MHRTPFARAQRRTGSWRRRPRRALKDRLSRNWPSRYWSWRGSRRRSRRFVHRPRASLRHDHAGLRRCRRSRSRRWSGSALYWRLRHRRQAGRSSRRRHARRNGHCWRHGNRWRHRARRGQARSRRERRRSRAGRSHMRHSARWRRCRHLGRNNDHGRRPLSGNGSRRNEPGCRRLCFGPRRRNGGGGGFSFGLNCGRGDRRPRYRRNWRFDRWTSYRVLRRFFLLRDGAKHIARPRNVRQVDLGLDFFFGVEGGA